ncbi:MAG TPA: ATP synthase F1 subunit gamma [Candidatus Krumholzibacteria bacterium]|nr:ATP synthase F1 subunit gamma [Candidatus Krumholzibacteria bacterium]HPD73032.1 ATP synthase F1 subunit gamma [Candidatus Krumholzibacteria bacterium]HRY41831.1 ATP synthase F1 subunit gamma [Candidatus Krumholzibacteria bacterium]
MPGAGVKTLNKRIRSVNSTKQITKAMKMVAAAKLNRSQGKMVAARPYAHTLTQLVEHLAGATEGEHPFFAVREVARRLVVVVTSDKGLCGSYNLNLIKSAQQAVDASAQAGVETELLTVGKKAGDYFAKRGYRLFARHDDFNGETTAERSNTVGDAIVTAFLDGVFDEVRVVYAEFVSMMTQRPQNRQLLPIAPPAAVHDGEVAALDYIWEPDQARLFAKLLPLYLRNRVFVTLMEAFTSEHAARMASMTAATDNAGELIDALTLQRNRERQAAITAELLDIVGGANAL